MTYGFELLDPMLVSAELHAEATSPAFPGLGGVLPGYGRQDDNLWGLGFEIRGTKSPHWTSHHAPASTFGHFGQSGSYLWIDPQRGAAAAFLGAKPFDADVHGVIWADLGDEILGRGPSHPRPRTDYAMSTMTGAWSDAPLPLRSSRSICAPVTVAASAGEA
jgi:CubicO group peptidase (beta-lactamase class C family)